MQKKRVLTMVVVTLCGLARAEFVTIGDAGNPADSNGRGAVSYTYRISAKEVTIAEIQASGAGSGNENYWNTGERTVGANAPASFVSINEAAKYCNWLTSGNVNTGAYQLNGSGVLTGLMTRAQILANGGLFYVLPTNDEWYKAAYYTGNAGDLWSSYANGTDTLPIQGTTAGWNYRVGSTYVNGPPNYTWAVGSGGREQNGTYDMMGNVWEWTEDFRWIYVSESTVCGGDYNSSPSSLAGGYSWVDGAIENGSFGFRVVAIGTIPEPASALLVVFGAAIGLVGRRGRRPA